jgi:hypothetical protein
LFGFVQLNDPDGWIWFIYYLSIGVVAIYHQFYSPILIKSMAFLTAVGILLYLPDVFEWINAGFPSITEEMTADSPMTELIREAGGLMLSFIVLLFITKKMYKL